MHLSVSLRQAQTDIMFKSSLSHWATVEVWRFSFCHIELVEMWQNHYWYQNIFSSVFDKLRLTLSLKPSVTLSLAKGDIKFFWNFKHSPVSLRQAKTDIMFKPSLSHWATIEVWQFSFCHIELVEMWQHHYWYQNIFSSVFPLRQAQGRLSTGSGQAKLRLTLGLNLFYHTERQSKRDNKYFQNFKTHI
jgi:hypothetical protein